MRITLSIDDDVLAAARQLAERDRMSVGEVVSALARQGLAREAGAPLRKRNGIPLLPKRHDAASISPEVVQRLRDADS